MKDQSRTKQSLIEEISVLKQRIQELEQSKSERKRAEEALRESEVKYRLIAENTADVISMLDMNLRFTYVSPASMRLHGFTVEEAMGRTLEQVLTPESMRLGLTVFEEELQLEASGKADPDRMRILELEEYKKDGSIVWVEVSLAFLRDKDRKPVEILMVSRDITKRKRAEEALREERQRLTGIIKGTNVGTWEWNVQTGETIFNDRWAEIIGYTQDEISPVSIETWMKFAHEDDLKASGELLEKHFCGEIDYYEFESRMKHKDGNLVWVLDRGKVTSWTKDGKPLMMMGTHQDITAQKQAENALRESEDRFRKLADATWEGIIIHRGGTIMDANESASKMFGWHAEEIIGKSVLEFLAPESIEPTLQKLSESPDTPQIYLEAMGLRKDKTVFPLEALGRPIRHKNLDARVLAIRDITERKQAEEDREKLEAKNRQLQKSESLGRMAGAIAHHFNNQLGVVIGNLEMAIDDLPQGVGPVKSLTAAMRAASKAAEVSGLMLTYLGQSFDTHELLDLSETCLQRLPILQAVMPKDMVLETDFPSQGPVISADANQIQQILTNLLTNAWEAVGEEGGSIHLRVKTVSPADIPTIHSPPDWQPQDTAYACLEVADTGCGIEDKDIEKLFDPFFSSKFTGRGMGLAVVMGIVRAHAGVVTVESEPGRGSSFRVFFPVSGEEILRQLDKAAPVPEIAGGGTILLVEDEEMVRDMAKSMLTRLGFTVLEAKDGSEAVEVFRQRQEKIRFVLCDLTMPRMNGWETLTALRKLAPDIPVILASGHDKAHVMAGDHSEWPQVFLGKPYKLKELSDAISQALVCHTYICCTRQG